MRKSQSPDQQASEGDFQSVISPTRLAPRIKASKANKASLLMYTAKLSQKTLAISKPLLTPRNIGGKIQTVNPPSLQIQKQQLPFADDESVFGAAGGPDQEQQPLFKSNFNSQKKLDETIFAGPSSQNANQPNSVGVISKLAQPNSTSLHSGSFAIQQQDKSSLRVAAPFGFSHLGHDKIDQSHQAEYKKLASGSKPNQQSQNQTSVGRTIQLRHPSNFQVSLNVHKQTSQAENTHQSGSNQPQNRKSAIRAVKNNDPHQQANGTYLSNSQMQRALEFVQDKTNENMLINSSSQQIKEQEYLPSKYETVGQQALFGCDRADDHENANQGAPENLNDNQSDVYESHLRLRKEVNLDQPIQLISYLSNHKKLQDVNSQFVSNPANMSTNVDMHSGGDILKGGAQTTSFSKVTEMGVQSGQGYKKRKIELRQKGSNRKGATKCSRISANEQSPILNLPLPIQATVQTNASEQRETLNNSSLAKGGGGGNISEDDVSPLKNPTLRSSSHFTNRQNVNGQNKKTNQQRLQQQPQIVKKSSPRPNIVSINRDLNRVNFKGSPQNCEVNSSSNAVNNHSVRHPFYNDVGPNLNNPLLPVQLNSNITNIESPLHKRVSLPPQATIAFFDEKTYQVVPIDSRGQRMADLKSYQNSQQNNKKLSFNPKWTKRQPSLNEKQISPTMTSPTTKTGEKVFENGKQFGGNFSPRKTFGGASLTTQNKPSFCITAPKVMNQTLKIFKKPWQLEDKQPPFVGNYNVPRLPLSPFDRQTLLSPASQSPHTHTHTHTSCNLNNEEAQVQKLQEEGLKRHPNRFKGRNFSLNVHMSSFNSTTTAVARLKHNLSPLLSPTGILSPPTQQFDSPRQMQQNGPPPIMMYQQKQQPIRQLYNQSEFQALNNSRKIIPKEIRNNKTNSIIQLSYSNRQHKWQDGDYQRKTGQTKKQKIGGNHQMKPMNPMPPLLVGGETHEDLSIDLISSENQGDEGYSDQENGQNGQASTILTYHDKIKMNLPPLLDAEAKRRMKRMQDANKTTAAFNKMDFIKESPNEQESSQFPPTTQHNYNENLNLNHVEHSSHPNQNQNQNHQNWPNQQVQSFYQTLQSDLLSNSLSLGDQNSGATTVRQEYHLQSNDSQTGNSPWRVMRVNRPYVDEQMYKVRNPFKAPKPILEQKKLIITDQSRKKDLLQVVNSSSNMSIQNQTLQSFESQPVQKKQQFEYDLPNVTKYQKQSSQIRKSNLSPHHNKKSSQQATAIEKKVKSIASLNFNFENKMLLLHAIGLGQGPFSSISNDMKDQNQLAIQGSKVGNLVHKMSYTERLALENQKAFQTQIATENQQIHQGSQLQSTDMVVQKELLSPSQKYIRRNLRPNEDLQIQNVFLDEPQHDVQLDQELQTAIPLAADSDQKQNQAVLAAFSDEDQNQKHKLDVPPQVSMFAQRLNSDSEASIQQWNVERPGVMTRHQNTTTIELVEGIGGLGGNLGIASSKMEYSPESRDMSPISPRMKSQMVGKEESHNLRLILTNKNVKEADKQANYAKQNKSMASSQVTHMTGQHHPLAQRLHILNAQNLPQDSLARGQQQNINDSPSSNLLIIKHQSNATQSFSVLEDQPGSPTIIDSQNRPVAQEFTIQEHVQLTQPDQNLLYQRRPQQLQLDLGEISTLQNATNQIIKMNEVTDITPRTVFMKHQINGNNHNISNTSNTNTPTKQQKNLQKQSLEVQKEEKDQVVQDDQYSPLVQKDKVNLKED